MSTSWAKTYFRTDFINWKNIQHPTIFAITMMTGVIPLSMILRLMVILAPTKRISSQGLSSATHAAAPSVNGNHCILNSEKAIALLASQSRVKDMLQWCNRNKPFLTGRSFLANREMATLLLYNPVTEDLDIEQIDGSDATFDIVLASMILKGEVSKVVLLTDASHAAAMDETLPDQSLLMRACTEANIPIALNEATADLLIQTTVGSTTTEAATNRVAYLLFNPIAGSGNPEEELKAIYEVLEPQIPLTVMYTKKNNEDLAEQARDLVAAIKNRPPEANAVQPLILASGGDGTVSIVAGATFHSGIPFGVIPRGTANAFASALGIPTDPIEACENILSGQTRPVDAAMCNDLPMTLLTGFGFEAGMVQSADRSLKKLLGPVAYVLGGAKQLVSAEPFQCTLVANNQRLDVEALAVTVAVVAPATSVMAQGFGKVVPDDGLLDVTVETATSTLESLDAMAHLLGAALVARPTEAETVLQFRAKEVKVTCGLDHKIVVDGELIQPSYPITFKVLPGALNVIAPPSGEEE